MRGVICFLHYELPGIIANFQFPKAGLYRCDDEMRKLTAGILSFLFLCPLSVITNAQNCISTNNNAVINFSCGINCAPVNLQVPDLRTTSDYTVSAISFSPFPFVSSAPAMTVPCASQDDKFFDTSFLPFSFCFYDSVFTRCVLGTNGVVTFDMINVLSGNNWDLDPPLSIPNTGTGNPGAGTCPFPNGTLYPRAAIMGPFVDIFPQTTDPIYKIETRTEGAAPCRKFVVSFSQVAMYNCSASRVTSQMVLHENTGIIDIYVESKPFCSFNGNIAIIGIQDWTRTRGLAAPSRNAGSWTAQNEAYRFTPSGGSSRFINSQIFTLSGTLIATASAIFSAPGLINLNFPNICPTGNSEQFVVKTTYASCSDTASTVTFSDTITINKTSSLNATATATDINCTTGATGTITVNVPANSGVPPYQYSLNGGSLQSSNIFTGLGTGSYTVFATDINGCSSTMNVTINRTGNLGVGTSVTNTSCAGVNNGSITILPPSVYTPIQYSLNGGAPQTGNVFTGLAASTYSVTVTDAIGCTGSTTVTVSQGPGVTANFNTTATSCSGANNGTITVTASNGTAPYQYSLNGGPFQNSNVFTGLAAATYTVTVRDVNGCNSSYSVTVSPGAVLNATVTKTDVSCNGGTNGTITVNISNGTAPYQYSLNNVSWQASNTFTGLPAGTYTVYYRDNNACANSQSVTINQPAAITASVTTQPVICFGQNSGQISVTASGGVSPYQYSIDGVNYQAANSFAVSAGTFIVYVRDNNGCISTQSVTVSQPAQLMLNLTMQDASCNGGADGRITASGSGGTGTLQYSIDGINFQVSGIFNVLPGTYTVTMKDANNCTASQSITVGLSNNLSITPAPDVTICEGSSVQLNVNTNANQFSWSPATALNNATIQNPVANPVTTTQYIVTATFGLCSAIDTIIVNVNRAPVPDAGADGDICYGQSYRLQGSGGVQFAWSPSASLSSASVFNPLSTPAQTITYGLSVIDANGCSSLVQDQVVVNVTPPIIVRTYPSDTVVFAGDQFQLLAASAGTNYTWSPPAGLSNPFVPDPVLTVTSDVTFNVIATTSAGCRGDGTVTIKVYKGPDIYMPTGFTPNGDGKNDKFKPFPVGIVKLNYFRVYNRWGQLIFSTNVLHEGWDGRLGGVEQSSGTYVWMVQGVTRDGRLITKKGTVTLIR